MLLLISRQSTPHKTTEMRNVQLQLIRKSCGDKKQVLQTSRCFVGQSWCCVSTPTQPSRATDHVALLYTDTLWCFSNSILFHSPRCQRDLLVITGIGLCLFYCISCTFGISYEVLAWFSVWSKVQMTCIWSSRCHCHSVICCFTKVHTGLTFLVPACPGCSGKHAIKLPSVYPEWATDHQSSRSHPLKVICNGFSQNWWKSSF